MYYFTYDKAATDWGLILQQFKVPSVDSGSVPDADQLGSVSMKNDSRELWIDCVKGLTIVMVVFHHTYAGYRGSFVFSPFIIEIYALLTPIRMPLFFLIAGLFARKSIFGTFGKFARTKLLYFVYFYVLWNVVSIVLRASFSSQTTNPVEYRDILTTLWNPNFTIWFLYGLLLAFSVSRLTRSVSPTFQLVVSLVVAMFIKFHIHGTDNVFLNTVQLYPFFLVGVYWSSQVRSWVAKAGMPRVALLATICISILYYAYLEKAVMLPHVYYSAALVTSATLMSALFLLQNTFFGKILGFIGAHSLYIYLLHFFPAAASQVAAHRLGVDSYAWTTIALGTAFSIVFCLVAYFVANRIPGLRYLYNTPDFEKIIGKFHRFRTVVPKAEVPAIPR